MTTVYVQTDEDWCPSFLLDAGEAKLLQLNSSTTSYPYMVSVWGADDFGMELQCISGNHASEIFHHICQMPIVTRDSLCALGFKYA